MSIKNKSTAATQAGTAQDMAANTTADTVTGAATQGGDTPAVRTAFLSSTTRFGGALFNVTERRQDGPVMTGSITLEGQRIPLSAFLREPEGKKRYLSLSIGEKGGMHYYGKLFRNDGRTSGAAPDYTGFVKVLACDGETDHANEQWDSAPLLQVCGWRERNADGSPRVSLYAAPRAVDEAELPL